jgi:hypothetical protein
MRRKCGHTKKMENKQRVFENSVLRQIFGPIRENNQWRRRKKQPVRALYNSPDIRLSIKAIRLMWFGHIILKFRPKNEI